ncbi:MAG: hypothetical protein ACRCTJ_01625 [Brevinema sp.]
MKFYLLLLILFFGACVKKEKYSPEDPFKSGTFQRRMQVSEPLVARYDIEPKLFWLDESGVSYEPLWEDVGYSAIYYEPVSNTYYNVEIDYIYPPNRPVTYDTNNIQDEKNYFNFTKKFHPKLPLRYVGSIDLTNRIYIATNNNLYVKRLKLLEDKEYRDSENKEQPLFSQVFPYIRYHDDPQYSEYQYIYYTNGTQEFGRVDPIGKLYFYRNIPKPE